VKENAIARPTKAPDARVRDLDDLRSRIAPCTAEDGRETTGEPVRPKARRKHAVTSRLWIPFAACRPGLIKGCAVQACSVRAAA
jgi:hypothetical protein